MMMIKTRYHGPTNYKGPRWSATVKDGSEYTKRIIRPQADNLNPDENARIVAYELAQIMGWQWALQSRKFSFQEGSYNGDRYYFFAEINK